MNMPPWYRDVLDCTKRVSALKVFFVVGCQKSGTTWLSHLLDGHPNVSCGHEGHFTDVLAPALKEGIGLYNRTPRTNWPLDSQDLRAALRLLADRILCEYIDRRPDQIVTAVGDKTPEAAVALPVLDLLYPDARFVHIIRDGRDGVVSGWAHLQRQGEHTKFATLADYAEFYARGHWVGYISAARHAAAALPGRYLEMRYEALHADPHAEARRLLTFLELPADDDTVARCVDAGSFERLTGGRTRGEEDAASHFRKGIVGDWREHFDDEALRRFEAVAGPLLADLGYETEASPPAV